MFVDAGALTPTQKGNIAEACITAAAVKLGIGVLKPVQEGLRYDLMFDFHPELARVQCKYASVKNDVVCVRLGTSRLTPHGYVRTTYAEHEVDLIIAFAPELDRCFALPIAEFLGQSYAHLRLAPPRNGQQAAIDGPAITTLGL